MFQFSSNRCAHRPLFHGKVWDEEELVDSSGNPYAHNDNEDNEDNDNEDNDNEDWFKWEPLCASYGEQLRILQRVVILPVLKFKCFVIWFKLKKNSFKNKKIEMANEPFGWNKSQEQCKYIHVNCQWSILNFKFEYIGNSARMRFVLGIDKLHCQTQSWCI